MKNAAVVDLQVVRPAKTQPETVKQNKKKEEKDDEETKEEQDSFRTLAVQYTGDEELSSARPLTDPLKELPAEQKKASSTQDPVLEPAQDPVQDPPPQDPATAITVTAIVTDDNELSKDNKSTQGLPRTLTKHFSTTTLDKHSAVAPANGPALPMSPTVSIYMRTQLG